MNLICDGRHIHGITIHRLTETEARKLKYLKGITYADI